jgi:hypothetical protein
MHATLALTLALAVVGTQPETIPAPPAYDAIPLRPEGAPHFHGGGGPLPQFAYPTGHPYPDVTPHGLYGPKTCHGWAYPNGICGHCCVHDPHSWANWWIPPGNMLPHYAYFPAEHGYFYFEPYNVTRVQLQQSFVASYGGDIRHPYEDSVFDRAYKVYKQRHPEDVDEDEIIDSDLPDTTPEDDVDLSPEGGR